MPPSRTDRTRALTDLNALFMFAKVADATSFSEAARRLGVPVSTLSRRVADLEDQLGVRLFERSTRRLRLTDVGSEVLEDARRTVEIGEAVDGIVSNQLVRVFGKLRIAAPPSLSESLLGPIVVAFQERHREVRIEIMVTERHVDPIAEGIDLAFHVGPAQDSSMVARQVLRFRHQLVASPGYLAANGTPVRPRDLLDHRIIAFSHFRPEYRWDFRNVNGRDKESVAFRPFLGVNDFAGVAAGLLAGAGIGDLSPIVVPDLVRDGRLVEVMADWQFPVFDLCLVHMAHKHLPRTVRVFRDFAAEMAARLFSALAV